MVAADSPAFMSVEVADIKIERALVELSKLDKDLFNKLRREFRQEIKPIAKELQGNIPRGGSPLSGMSRSSRIARTLQTPDARSPYVWKLPTVRVDLGTQRRRGAGSVSIGRIQFLDKRPFSAFSILETARQAQSFRGANMIGGIEAKFPSKGKGRWVIQQFYERRPEIRRILVRMLGKYMRGVNNRMARKLGGF